MPPARQGRFRRWSKLFALGSAPGNAEEAREFLQRRMSLFFGVLASIGWIFYAMSLSMMQLYLPGRLAEWLTRPSRVAHLVVSMACTAAWAFTRGKPRSPAALGNLDGAGMVVLTFSLAGMMFGTPAVFRPEIEFLFFLNVILVARASIVPSTPLRSLLVGSAGVVFVTIAATSIHVRARDAGMTLMTTPNPSGLGEPVPLVPPPFMIAFVCVVWGAVSVSLSVLISRVIYGLHKKIAQVAQLGQYHLDEKIGEGGMGIVFRASHAMLRRPTAIKLLQPEKAGEEALGRFEREVQNTAKLTHPNTVAIYDYGRTPEGLFYYAMEYLDGLDLDALVSLDGPQAPSRVVHILKQAAAALGEAHRVGLVHRDVKPANVILCERGGVADFVKVVDFGLVKEVSGADQPSTTAATAIAGTPLYMAPEAIATPDRIDGRSDIYALGAVAYYLLSAVPVFDAKTVIEVCARHLHSEVTPPSKRFDGEVPPGLEALVLACLEKRPDRRPASAEALIDALSTIDVPIWTARDANVWWSSRAADLRGLRKRASAPPPIEYTVDVNLEDRQKHA